MMARALTGVMARVPDARAGAHFDGPGSRRAVCDGAGPVSNRHQRMNLSAFDPGGRFEVIVGMALLAYALALSACGPSSDAKKRIEPVYDKNGRLQLLKYDSNGDGKVDTSSYMDGARVLRIEIDNDEDGKIDRWEYYGPDQKLEKVGLSRANDGNVDAWAFEAPDGSIARIEVSTKRDGKVDRVEYHEKGTMVRAEEDTDGDGRIDKWETYDGPRLASVAFDTLRRGTPDRRLVYGADGTVQLEVDRAGDGHFVVFAEPAARPDSRRP